MITFRQITTLHCVVSMNEVRITESHSDMIKIKKLPELKPRKSNTHKGSYGRVLVLAGSPGMTGAAYLCSKAALRSGSGIVTLGVPESLNPVMEVKLTCVMTAVVSTVR